MTEITPPPSRKPHPLALTAITIGLLLVAAYVFFLCVPRLTDQNSQRPRAMSAITTFSTAVELFKMDVGRYPTEAEGLQALLQQPADAPNWAGPYLKSPTIPLDPWGTPYLYLARTTSDGDTAFLILSYGPARRPGPGNIGSNNTDSAAWLSAQPAAR